MFKKLKDKLSEEMKNSQFVQQYGPFGPAKSSSGTLNASSSDISNPSAMPKLPPFVDHNESTPTSNSVSELPSTSTPKSQSKFETVDLSEKPPGRRSRHSSLNSTQSDAALFPVYEPSYTSFHVQSDMESASEFGESQTGQGDTISKEQLLTAFQKVQMRYNKYRGRYTDLLRYSKDLERERDKFKTVLQETQDRALRRISELRETCELEKKAKAHMEEVFRNDVDEKENVIKTLHAKIQILSPNNGQTEESSVIPEKSLIDLSEDAAASSEELQKLKEKNERLQVFVDKCRTNITIYKEKHLQALQEKDEYVTRIQNLEDELAQLKNMQDELQQNKHELCGLRKQEELSALQMAESKMQFHMEIEHKDEELKQLKQSLLSACKENEAIKEKYECLHMNLQEKTKEIGILEEERQNAMRDLSKSKAEALRVMQQEMEKRIAAAAEIHQHKQEELQLRLEQLEGSLKESSSNSAENDIETLKSNNAKDVDELCHKHHLELEKLEKTLKDTEESSSKCSSELNQAQTLNKKLKEQVHDLEELCQALKNQCEVAQEESKSLKLKHSTEVSVMKQEHAKDIEQLQQNLNDSEDKLKLCSQEFQQKKEMLSKQLDELRKSSAEEINNLRKQEKDDYENQLRQIEEKHRHRVEELEQLQGASHSEVLAQLDVLKVSYATLENEADSMRGTIESLTAENVAFQKINLELENTRIEKESLQKTVDELSQHCTILGEKEAVILSLEGEKTALQTKLLKIKEVVKQKEMQHKEDLQKIESLQSEVLGATSNLEKIANETKAKNSELSKLHSNISERDSAIQSMETEKVNLQAKLVKMKEAMKQKILHHKDEVNQLRAELDAVQVKSAEELSTVSRLSGENSTLQTKLAELSEDRDKKIQGLEDDKAEIETKLLKVETALKKSKKMSADAHESQVQVVSELTEELKKSTSTIALLQEEKRTFMVQQQEWEDRLQQVKEDFNTEHSKKLSEYEQMCEKCHQLEQEVLQKLQDQRQLSAELSAKVTECCQLEEKLCEFQQDREKQKAFENEMLSKDNKLLKLTEEYQALQQEFNTKLNLESQLICKAKECSEMSAKLQMLEESAACLAEADSNLQQITQQLSHCQNELVEKESEMHLLTTKLKSHEEDISKIRDSERKLIAELAAKTAECDSFAQKVFHLEGQLEEKTSQCNQTEEWNKKYQDCQIQLQTLKAECQEMVEKLLVAEHALTEHNVTAEQVNFRDQKICQLESDLTDAHSQKVELEVQLTAAQEDLEKVVQEKLVIINSNSDEIKNLHQLLEGSCIQLQGVRDEKQNLSTLLETLENESATKLSEYENRMREAEEQLSRYVEESKLQVAQNAKLEELQKTYEELKSTHYTLEESYKAVHEKLLQKENEFPELLAFKQKYIQADISLKEKEKKLTLLLTVEQQLDETLLHLQGVEKDCLELRQERDSLLNKVNAVEKDFTSLRKEFKKVTKTDKDVDSMKQKLEEEHAQKIKQLVTDFEEKLAEREKEAQTLVDEQQEKRLIQESKFQAEHVEQITHLESELINSHDTVQNMLDAHILQLKAKDDEILKLKEEHEVMLHKLENECQKRLERAVREKDIRCKEELEAFTQEWTSERKHEATPKHEQELENAMAAMESRTAGVLHKEIESMSNKHLEEVAYLRQLLDIGKRDSSYGTPLEEATELEYLRNILFEYMMGREPMTLIKVIAALVKFSSEQTRKIMEREEQKQTVMGHLGLV